VKEFDLTPEIVPVQVLRTNQNPLADFLDCLRNFVERTGQRLNVFTLQRSDERFRKFLGQLLGDSFIFAPALGKCVEVARRFAFLQIRQQIDQVVNAAVGLLRACLEQVEKLFVVAEKSTD